MWRLCRDDEDVSRARGCVAGSLFVALLGFGIAPPEVNRLARHAKTPMLF